MRIMIKENVYGWVMSGLIGKDAKWFFGFSRVPPTVSSPDHINCRTRVKNNGYK